MSYSLLASLFRVPLSFVVVICLAVSIAQAQFQQASCTFKLVQNTEPTPPFCYGRGVNDWGSVVGLGGSNGKACIRYANGGTSWYLAPGATLSQFNARNNNGATVGYFLPAASAYGQNNAFMLQASTVTLIVDPKAVAYSTSADGINKYNSIVGSYLDKATGRRHGFKRYSNGSYNELLYPAKNSGGSWETYPRGINDNGVVVGTYFDASNQARGFVYHSGQWATLDYPNSASSYTNTEIWGISNSDIIVGTGYDNGFTPLRKWHV